MGGLTSPREEVTSRETVPGNPVTADKSSADSPKIDLKKQKKNKKKKPDLIKEKENLSNFETTKYSEIDVIEKDTITEVEEKKKRKRKKNKRDSIRNAKLAEGGDKSSKQGEDEELAKKS